MQVHFRGCDSGRTYNGKRRVFSERDQVMESLQSEPDHRHYAICHDGDHEECPRTT